jgi:predicted ester cyclase
MFAKIFSVGIESYFAYVTSAERKKQRRLSSLIDGNLMKIDTRTVFEKMMSRRQLSKKKNIRFCC